MQNDLRNGGKRRRILAQKEERGRYLVKLACNFYVETEELVKENKISIDYFKFPSLGFHESILKDLPRYERFLQSTKKVKPLIIHGLYPSPHNICSPNFKRDLRLELVYNILKVSESPGISLHFDGAEENMSRDQIVEITVENIRYLKETFKGIEFISIENVEKGKSCYINDPGVISEVIKRSDAYFLLDISHAICAANDRKEDFNKYLHELPLQYIYEIHINGWAEKNGDIMCHLKINEEGYKILQSILNICSPQIVTLEYGRHNDRIGLGCPIMKPDCVNDRAKEEIIEQVNRLRQIIGMP
jgi:uncharacterized protein (UPF0276 family)